MFRFLWPRPLSELPPLASFADLICTECSASTVFKTYLQNICLTSNTFLYNDSTNDGAALSKNENRCSNGNHYEVH